MTRSIEVVKFVLVVVVAATVLIDVANGRLVNVGGRQGWNTGVNYSEWSSQQSLYVGDWISFRFDKNQFDVIEVNETGYKECNNNFMLANITGGAGRDVYNLTEARTYYFICTKGYCWGGMKVAINVTMSPPPSPSPQGNNVCMGTNKSILVLAISILVAFIVNAY